MLSRPDNKILTQQKFPAIHGMHGLNIIMYCMHKHMYRILSEIGSGQFAFVNKAQWIEKSGASLTVAVKSLHSPASQEERVKFLQEAAIMSQFVHPNVVRLIGTVKTAEEVRLYYTL